MNWGVCALLAASVGLAACGGRTEDDDATATDGATDAIDDSDAGFTACSGPSGQKLCGGKCGESCSSDQCGSTDVFPFPDAVAPDAALGVCFDGPGVHGGSCNQCADGLLCVPDDVALTDPDPAKGFANLSEADPGYAVMYDLNGMGNLVRYADRSGYSGKAIPDTPAGCPEDIGFQVCGGSCGACPTGFQCTGRSPLHPYSLCVNDFSGEPNKPQPDSVCVRGAPNGGGCDGIPQNPPLACLTFRIGDIDQPVADANGICVEASLCAAAAASYPGGVYCTN